LFNRPELSSLLPALFQFFIDIEFTGRSSQFVDKFESRYYVARIMSDVWMLDVHRIEVEKVSETNLFRCFLDRWLNDTIYLLDEAFAKIIEIKELQEKATQSGCPHETRQELQDAERRVRPYLALANENLNLMAHMTKGISKPFRRPEFVTRVACMLNLYADQLAGQNCGRMSIQHGRSLGFNPKKLLTQITQIYINLDSPEFCAAVVDDERSYSREVLERVKNILTRFDLLPPEKIKLFSQFTEAVYRTASSNRSRLGCLSDQEIPEEFFDPILASLMTDPVILPSSRMTVDRAMITRQLLSNPIDPFNRTPLSEADLIPNVELKKRIDEFLATATQRSEPAHESPTEAPATNSTDNLMFGSSSSSSGLPSSSEFQSSGDFTSSAGDFASNSSDFPAASSFPGSIFSVEPSHQGSSSHDSVFPNDRDEY
jgi:ubiquitin conjugation factor E4 B